MPAKLSGKVKKATVRVKKKNGNIYVYERQIKYDPEKKYNRILSSKLIGKIPNGSEVLISTRPKRPAEKKVELKNQPNEKIRPVN